MYEMMHNAAHKLANILRDMDSIYGQYELAIQEQESANAWRKSSRSLLDHPGKTDRLAALQR